MNLGFTILIVYVLFISSANDHKMRREVIGQNDINSYSDRDSLGEYYSAWKSHNGKPDTVILIAALGGGSRAGYWTGIHLDRIYDSTMVFNSKSKIFAISTVSGGTSGTNMFIAKKVWNFTIFLIQCLMITFGEMSMDIIMSAARCGVFSLVMASADGSIKMQCLIETGILSTTGRT